MIGLFAAGRRLPPLIEAAISQAPAYHVAIASLSPILAWANIYLLYRRSAAAVLTALSLGGFATINLVALSHNSAWDNPAPWVTFSIWFISLTGIVMLVSAGYFKPAVSPMERFVERTLNAVFGAPR